MSATIALHDSDDPFAKCIPATIAMLELFIVSLFCVSIHIDMYASEDRFTHLAHACMNAHVAFFSHNGKLYMCIASNLHATVQELCLQ